jgi:hypothetical protein
MNWLKRNVILVAGGAVALVLLAAAGYFLWNSYQKDKAVSGELNREADQITRLNNASPSVTDDNIQAAKTEQERVSATVEKFREHFAPVGYYTNITSADFKFLLANTLNELNTLAESQGVRRPKDFAYTFDTQRGLVVFNPNELLPWTFQLLEIRALCETIYSARVHSILRILRPSVSTNDNAQVVLRGAQMTTNTVVGAVTTPYEVTFQGFSSELAAVLEGLASSPQCFLVQNINVEKSPSSGTTGTSGMDPAMAARYGVNPAAMAPTPPSLADRYGLGAGRYGANPAASRYGANPAASRYGANPAASRYGGNPAASRYGEADGVMRDRYGLGPGAARPAAPTYYRPPASSTRRGPETVLDEQLLRFTLRLEAVRPLIAAN